NPEEAVRLAKKACELTDYQQPVMLDTLGVAYAAAGRFQEAVAVAEKAINIAKTTDKNNLAEQIQERLQLYKACRPYREK
ncbi:MAG: tetratricopeptide repeat protein, partial [Planctomycetota bacterium]